MNKKLKALKKEAVDFALSVVDASGVYKGKPYLEVVDEHFAASIVRACAEVQYGRSVSRHGHDKHEDATAILEHFNLSKK